MARSEGMGSWRNYIGPMTDQMEHIDPLGGQDIHPQHAPGEYPEDVIRHWLDVLQGRGDQYTPDSPGGIMGPGGGSPPGDYNTPEDFIRQMLEQQQGNPEEGMPYDVAGDVVPLRPHPVSAADARMRLQSPGVGARSQGMQSIQNLGNDPKVLDLMDVLMGRFGK